MIKKIYGLILLLLCLPAYAAVDIVVNVTDDPDPIPADGLLTYTVNVANNGPDDATGVKLTSVLPAGSTLQSVVTAQGSCSGTTTITCNLGNLDNNANTSVIIKVTVPATSGVINNTFSSTRDQPDNNASNDGKIEQTTVVQSADLQMTKTGSASTVAQGVNYTYTLSVKNNGPYAHPNTSNVSVTDNIPAGMQLTALPTGTGWSCSSSAGTPMPQNGPLTATCVRPTQTDNALTNGSSFPTISVPVRALTYGTVTNEATVTSSMADKNTANNTATVNTTVTQSFDVGMGKNLTTSLGGGNSTGALTAGVGYYYRLRPTLAIGSDTSSTTLSVTDALPNGITVTSLADVSATTGAWSCSYSPNQTLPFTVSASNPVTLTCLSSTAYSNNGTATINLADINFSFQPTGEVSPLANTGTVTACKTANMSQCGSAAGERITGTPTVLVNTSSTSHTVNSSADLNIVKTINAGGSTRQLNTTAVYTLTWANAGPAPIPAGITTTITDTLPAGISVTAISASGWTCPSTASPIVGPATITCTRNTAVSSGSSGTITLTATFTSTGVKTNTAAISSGMNDPNLSDNQSSNTVTVVDNTGGAGGPWHDLTINKDDDVSGYGPDPVPMTANVSYRLRVRNLGPNQLPTTRPITVTDTIPANSSFVSATGANWSCSFATPVVTCIRSAMTLNANADANDITVVLKANSGSSMTDTAQVSVAAGDVNSANNSASESTTILSNADLKLTKTASASSVYLGDNITYTFKVENLSGYPAPANTIQLTDVMGTNPGATHVSNTGAANDWTCNTSSNFRCTYNNVLAVGAASTFTVTVKTSTQGNNRANTASIAFVNGVTTIADPDTSNNSSTITIDVIPKADLQISKSASLSSVSVGQNLTYTISAVNNGPSPAVNVKVIDTLPNNLTVMSIAPTGTGTCQQNSPATGQIQCTWASIGNGSSQSLTMVVRATQPAEGTILTNTASISSDITDLVTTNNTATVNTSITPAVIDLIVQKKDAVDPVAQAGTVVYTIIVDNSGPSVATNVVLTENLPHTYLSYMDATPTQGSCGTPDVNHKMLCSLGNIEAGQRVSIVVRMKADQIGVDTNSISVTATENDSTPSNNSASETTTVQLGTDVQITKTTDKNNVFVGVPFIYTLKVYNQGPANSTNTVLTDVIPAGIEYQSATTNKGSCSYTSGNTTLTCSMGTFGPNTSAEISINAIARQLGLISNVANVSNSAPEIVLDNNQATATVNSQLIVSGRVFNDNGGDVGNIAANAYNSVQDSGEAGINNSPVRLTDCANTVIAETSTNAAGDYQFIRNSNLPNPYCIVQTNTSGFSSVSGIGSGLGSYSRSADRIMVTNVSVASYTSGNFGDANLNVVLTEDGQHTVIRGAVTDYPHQLISYAPIQLTQMTQILAQQPAASADQPWQAVVYRDSNCNGMLDKGETMFSPTAASPVLLQPDNRICLVQRVFVPINADANAQQLAKLQASYQISLSNPSEIKTGQTAQRQDNTLIGSAGLDLQKRVRVVASCPSTAADTNPFVTANQASNGNFLEYEITYRNNSVKNLVDVSIKDSVPSGTIYQSVSCSVNPVSCVASQVNGALLWQMTGNLPPAKEGKVRFCVAVP